MTEISVLLHVYGEREWLERIDAAEIVGGENHGVQLRNYLRQDLQALDKNRI